MTLAGLCYRCILSDKQIEKLLEDVFGYKAGGGENRKYLKDLLEGWTVRIPIEWAAVVPEVTAPKHPPGIQISLHRSSEEVVVASKIHPVMKAYLEREHIGYQVDCNPSLVSVIKNE
jgi:hypothetical protein